MKRLTLLIAFVGALFIESNAQKFALIDMEYILKNIPAYEMANEQLKQVSEKWEKEVSAQAEKVEALYKEYQANSIFYTDDQKKAKEEAILEEDKKTQELKRNYFGPEGELFKKREALMKPIQDDIYNAVKSIADTKGYQMVMDRASAASVIFASPRIDISNEVLSKLGYSK
ncbi:MAG: OmpH family outer membrane protein [Bacteroidetes bacterium]|uniref:OmpH family outer membrane protein n=1 Tax=Candidatus Caccoplasma merdipullorum TaxID=2840718 RepID=A0A9D9E4T2_9BACT|nr:OmpH family outer membrane protein [Candidatus Caccoplasma merdipullorum]